MRHRAGRGRSATRAGNDDSSPEFLSTSLGLVQSPRRADRPAGRPSPPGTSSGDGSGGGQPASNSRVSTTRLEKPHSLSYQATTFTCRPSTRVSSESKMDDAGLPVMSDDTSGS